MKKVIAGLAISAALAATPALAQGGGPTTRHYVQCFAAASFAVTNKDPTVSESAKLIALFFAGATFGSDPNIDLTAALRAESVKLTPATIKDLLTQCSTEVKGRGDQITAAGKALEASSNP